ncbi:hypothetical protein NDU88_011904 [Pleurodeles waltl]|uniref:Uncharacterized protein n=1 Tax=Pleurodeles waltl TaxID=8319 RepID=A0AAV7R4D6_PLEWA|nr:hypothetical protein NDU88_011904 [Pleurodeles waltl]
MASPPYSTGRRGTHPRPPQPSPRREGPVATAHASRQPRAAKKPCGPGPGPARAHNLTGGYGAIRLRRAPPASGAPHLLPTGPQGEPLPGPHSSFVAAPSAPLRLWPGQTPAGPSAPHRLPRQRASKCTNRGGPGPFAKAYGWGEHLQHLRIRRN